MVMEYMEGGDLDAYLKRKYPQGMPEPEARRLLCQIASAFQYLSSRGLSHRDLKPANILMTDHSNGKLPDAKLSDFGFARHYDANSGGIMTSKVGSPLYMAPEVLDQRPYSPSVDLWSTGIIFMQMLTAVRPFPHARQEQDIIDFVKDSTRMAAQIASLKLSPEGKALLTSMLTTDPSKRPTWESFLESDYVRPKSDLAASVVAGVANWILRVMDYETGMAYSLPVEANFPVSEFRNQVFKLVRPHHNFADMVLLSPRRGVMADGKTVGEYFELSAAELAMGNQSGGDRLTCHMFFRSTWNGGLAVYEPKEAALKIPERSPLKFEALSSNVPIAPLSADIATWSLDEVQRLAQEVTTQLNSNGKVENWHSKLMGWKMAIESHMNHANELLTFSDKVKRMATQMQSTRQRLHGMLTYANYLRAHFSSLIKSFERVQLVIKEVSPAMARIPNGIPAMFEEARSISLAPLREVFPTVAVESTATLIALINEEGMKADLAECVRIHRSLLTGELMFAKSSDPDAALRYGLENVNYQGSSWVPTIAAVTNKQAPILISSMADLNRHLSSPLNHTIVSDYAEVDRAVKEVIRTHQELNDACKLAISALSAALQKPSSFMLTPDMITDSTPLLAKILDLYNKLNSDVTLLVSRTNTLIVSRQDYDRRCVEQWKSIIKHRAPFEEFEHKLQEEWSGRYLDFIASKSRSLDKLLVFPREYLDMLAEIERRRLWVNAMTSSLKETVQSYDNLIEEERKMRDNWWASHAGYVTRFREIVPPNYEILSPMPAGYMRTHFALQGLTEYPAIKMPASSSSNAASTSSSSLSASSATSVISLPEPQSPTEEETFRLSSVMLLRKVLEMQRENEALKRQRLKFFQTGVDESLRQEYAHLLEENQALKDELKKYQH